QPYWSVASAVQYTGRPAGRRGGMGGGAAVNELGDARCGLERAAAVLPRDDGARAATHSVHEGTDLVLERVALLEAALLEVDLRQRAITERCGLAHDRGHVLRKAVR